MNELRLVGAFLAGAAAPAVLVFWVRDTCAASDVCLVGAMAYILGMPLAAIAGVVAARITPRDEGWTGFPAAAIGIPVGIMVTLAMIRGGSALGEVLALFGPPLFVALALAYGATRFLARPGSPGPPPVTPDEPE